jgi:hypothetical protein
MNENREFVWRRLTDTFSLAGHEISGRAWLIILFAILTVGLVYVVWMYVRDGHSIGWFWGGFLALLRLGVYATLAVVFLLPAFQNWEETSQRSKVVLTFDVSGSMGKQDDPVQPGVPPEKRPSRQDKVIAFLGEPSSPDGFFKRLQKTNPVTMYRWGAYLDENYLVVQDGQLWDRKAWDEATHEGGKPSTPGEEFAADRLSNFLKPDLKIEAPDGASDEEKKAFRERKEKLERLVKSTNVGEAALSALSKEINNLPQGIVLFTDCRSTEGGPQAFKDLAERAKRAKVPVFVVVVGEDRPETRIEVVDVRGPDKARPEDPFPIAVDVTGIGLSGRNITISLDIFKPGSDPKKDQPFKTVEKQVTFKGTQLPRAEAEFPITPTDYGDIPGPEEEKPTKPGEKPAKPKPVEDKPSKPEFKVGDWHFVARVARDPAEINNEPFHTKEPVVVRVEKKPMRVLLFASAPLRDYQFVRTMLVREADKKRLELSIYLQPLPGQARRNGIVQDVPPDRMLTRFPDKLDDKKLNEDAVYNLANYDVIVAFDPNWSELTKEQSALLDRWVSQQGGGLVLIGGPIHTLELARVAAHLKGTGGDRDKLNRLLKDNEEVARMKPILDLYPVVLKDIRLEKDRNTAIPAGLHFTGATPEMEFLKLDEENEKTDLLDAWKEFFRGANADKDARLLRGFYGYYPVEKAKDTAVTVATFKDDTSTDKTEPPYLVIMPNYGAGRLVWLGSGETWRLRQYREVWHERFWTKLVRYASAGSTGKTTRRIIPAVGNKFDAGQFFEVGAQCFGKDLLPLKQDQHPKVILRPPVGVADLKTEYEMAPRSTGGEEWDGRFQTRLLLKSPGEYGLTIKIDEPDGPSTDHKIKIIETDTELENTRPDLAAAYELASDAEPVLERLEDSGKKLQLKQALQRHMVADKGGEAKPAGSDKDRLRLVFDLRSAALIPDCMKTVVNKQESRGKVDDIWDQGLPLTIVLKWFSIGMGVLAGILAVVALVLFAGGRPYLAALVGAVVVGLLALAAYFVGRPYLGAYPFSVVLGIVVGLLSVEWLTRKLLRLA